MNYKFKKGDYVIVVNPHSLFKGLVFRVNRRRYNTYYLEVTSDITYSKLPMSKETILRSLHYNVFSEKSLKHYNQTRLDGDKL